MELQYIAGAVPEDYRPDFDSFLFNSPRNLFLQAPEGWRTFALLRPDKKKILVWIHFHLRYQTARSPLRNPFGSFECSPEIEPRELFRFVEWVTQQLEEAGAKMIEIVHPPMAYAPAITSLLTSFLLNVGYQISASDLGAYLPITTRSFESGLSSWEKRKLGMCRKAGLRVVEGPLTRLQEVFQFIHDCRAERGQTLSLQYGELRTIVETFPERFTIFAVFDGNTKIAASILIEVGKGILYNFYSAHSRVADNLSPVVLLMEAVYDHCRQQQFQLLDLGTSMLEGKPNFSLLDFKLHLGAQPTPKFTFSRHL